MAVAGAQPDASSVPPDHHAEPVVLNLVDPAGAGRRTFGTGWQAGLDEAGKSNTQHHTGGDSRGRMQCRSTTRQQRTNVWHEKTSRAQGPKRPSSGPRWARS